MESGMETQIAVIHEKLNRLLEENTEAKESRKAQYKATEDLRVSVQSIEFRMVSIEKTVADNQPTLQEFIAIKHKVQGAGIFGKLLWGLAGLTIGAVAYVYALVRQKLGL